MTPPVIVNRPVRMKYADIIIPKWSLDEASKILQSTGALHLEEKGKGVREYEKLLEKVEKTLNIIRGIMSNYARGKVIDAALTNTEIEEFSVDKISGEVERINKTITGLGEKVKEYEENISGINDALSFLSLFPEHFKANMILFKGKRLSVIPVTGNPDQFNMFLSILRSKHVAFTVLFKTSRENFLAGSIAVLEGFDETVELAVSAGLHVLSLEKFLENGKTVGVIIADLKSKLSELKDKRDEIRGKLEKLINENLDYLAKYMLYLENIRDRLTALIKSYGLKYLTVIGGWIPADKIEGVVGRLRENNIAFYMDLRDPVKGRENPPTLLENPRVMRWFEPIVKFIGAPGYWEWDPTPIISYSFAFFYGLMLGDMGYAIGIILSVLYLLDKFVIDTENRDYVFFKKAIMLSSGVGFIIGALSGSVLGISLPWGSYPLSVLFTQPQLFLVVAIIIGLIHVNIAHALTLVKAIYDKSRGDILIETGLFITEVFGIPYVMYSMLNTPIPGIPISMYGYFLYAALAGIGLIIAGTVINMGGLGLLMWLFSLTGLLGDVLSYSRLAGVGLATFYLGQSFNIIALMAYDGLSHMLPSIAGIIAGGLMALFVAAFGHIVNTALSAIGSFIHSLRLCFVEFLSKFYEGNGYMFEPFRLVLKRKIIIE